MGKFCEFLTVICDCLVGYYHFLFLFLLSLYREAADLDLEQFGINFMYSGLKKDLDNSTYVHMRECSVCRLRGTKELFKKW